MSFRTRLLLGRFLTRSGDQAWDFAVPIVLLQLFPGELRIAAVYYLVSKTLNVVALPKLASLIDHLNRLKASRVGIALQLAGVVIGATGMYALAQRAHSLALWSEATTYLIFAYLVAGGFLSSLGSSFMDIAIANDLVPAGVATDDLASFNARLRQLDLLTEVASPVAAGLLLTIEPARLIGFFLIAAWNLLSFFPELLLIQSVLLDKRELLAKKIVVAKSIQTSIIRKLTDGWRAFFREPVALVALAYACLWLSALSPHGVLLTGFLKDGWRLPEWQIGAFRAAGAIFGLIATVLYPWGERRWGLVKAARNFLMLQTAMLLIGLALVINGSSEARVLFLLCVLLSRIGLYGFSLGEMQIRQVAIQPSARGEVNGFATALTGVATLMLYGLGALLPSTEDFRYLIIASVTFVTIGCLIYLVWSSTKYPSQIQSRAD